VKEKEIRIALVGITGLTVLAETDEETG